VRSRLVSVPARLGLAVAVACALARSAHGAEPDVSINEIHGWGGDWVELYNPGSAAVDLSGWRITDCDEQGRSRLSRALSFPRGSTLGPHAYLLVVGDKSKKKNKKDREESDAQRVCSSRTGTRCFKASWKIDQKGGDVVRLIAPDGRLLSEATYPAGVVAKARSWSRLPNGAGAFTVSEPTPGRENAPPAP
jgi:hypothetical protein